MERVADAMRRAAAEAILPRFRQLGSAEIEEKSPGEVVTVADREAERILADALTAILPGSRVVGEEAVAARPDLLQGLDSGWTWLVDPLDGTANFVAGSPCFSVMVALLREGETAAAWMLSPATGTLHAAERGAGATVDGTRIKTAPAPADPDKLAGAVLTRFLPEALRARVERGGTAFKAILPGLRCAGEEYPAIVRAERNFALYWRALPWDHAPGTLFLAEAGGRAARLDGAPYRPGDGRPGLLAAQDADTWHLVRDRLIGSGAPG